MQDEIEPKKIGRVQKTYKANQALFNSFSNDREIRTNKKNQVRKVSKTPGKDDFQNFVQNEIGNSQIDQFKALGRNWNEAGFNNGEVRMKSILEFKHNDKNIHNSINKKANKSVNKSLISNNST